MKNAYWDLVFAISNLEVQRQSLALAQQSLKDNRARVEIGTMAPIDIVEAQAEVARREESVILAEAAISRAEDRLRALIFNPVAAGLLDACGIEPTEQVAASRPMHVDVEGAVSHRPAEAHRPEPSQKQLESNDISIRYFKNQSLPDVNASLNYSAQAIGGTRVHSRSELRLPGDDRRRAREELRQHARRRCSAATSRRGTSTCR